MLTRVYLFAGLREAVGAREINVELPDDVSVAELRERLLQAYPALGPLMARVAVAVNEEYAPAEQSVRAGDVVALIPPVSGGAGADR